ncbi:MAG: hypothetical protein GY938_05065 [Ketobacter sp.]|nr:hypothetical protein [Ketobacter sp.]
MANFELPPGFSIDEQEPAELDALPQGFALDASPPDIPLEVSTLDDDPGALDTMLPAITKSIQNIPERFQQGVGGLQRFEGEIQMEAAQHAAENRYTKDFKPDWEDHMRSNDRLAHKWLQNEGILKKDHSVFPTKGEVADFTKAIRDLDTRQRNSLGDFLFEQATGMTKAGEERIAKAKETELEIKPAGWWTDVVSGGIGSLVEQTPALLASIALRNPAPTMGYIGTTVTGHSYSKARDKGLSGNKARQYAALSSAAEAIPEMVPLGILLKPGGKFLARVAKGGAAEYIQEGITEAINIGLDMGYLDESMTWGEALAQINKAATSGGVAGVGMSTVAHPTNMLRDALIEKVHGKGETVTPEPEAPRATGDKLPAPDTIYQPGPDADIMDPDVVKQPKPTVTAAGRPTSPVERNAEGLLRGAGYSDDQIADMDAEQINDAAQEAQDFGVEPVISDAQDTPSREPVSDITAQLDEMANPNSNRGAVYLPEPTLKHMDETGNSHLVDATGIALEDFDGKGGTLIVENQRLADMAIEARDRGAPIQKIVGVLTGSGTGKPVDGSVVVRQKDEAGATTQETLTTPEQAQEVADSFEQDGRTVETATPEQVLDEREASAQAELDIDQVPDGFKLDPVEMEPPIDEADHRTPTKVETAEDIEAAVEQVETEPTDAQKEAGNYKKGHIDVGGLDITVETPKGAMRRGKDRDGKEWENESPAHYGYVKRTKGADGDHVDVYVGDNPKSDKAFIVDQVDPDTGKFDEHKAILGVDSIQEAESLYDGGFNDGTGPKRRKNVSEVGVDEFKEWLKDGDQQQPYGHIGEEIEESVEKEPGRIEKAPEANYLAEGKKAFEDGGKRGIPKVLQGSENVEAAKDWYKGWDEANLAAPVEKEAPQKSAKNEHGNEVWRTNFIAARKKAKELGIDIDGKQHINLIGAIENALAEPVENKPVVEVVVESTSKTPDSADQSMRESMEKAVRDLGGEVAAPEPVKAESEKQKEIPHPNSDDERIAILEGIESGDIRYVVPPTGGLGWAVGNNLTKAIEPKTGARLQLSTTGKTWLDGWIKKRDGKAEPAKEQEPTTYDAAADKTEYGADDIFPKPRETLSVSKDAPTIPQEEADAIVQSWKDVAKRIGKEKDNSNKVIISLFDATGSWSKPWRDAGYEVFQFDAEHGDDIFENFPIGKIQEIEESGKTVAGLLSACPCTTFAGSGARWWKDRHDTPDRDMVTKLFGEQTSKNFDTPVEANTWMIHMTAAAVEFSKAGFHVLENPIGRIGKMSGLPDPLMRFDPYNYGDPYTKRTQLWGDFNPDLPTANVDPVEGSKIQSKLRGDNAADKRARSLTPEGFAYSFFMANDPDAKGMLEEKPVEDIQETGNEIAPRKLQRGAAAKNISTLLDGLGIRESIMQGEDAYHRIENDPFMDLVIERLPHDEGTGQMLSLAHYVEQNGDLINDSEMVWTINEDGTLKLYDTIPGGMTRGQRPPTADTTFANMFAKNLIEQGFGKVDLSESQTSVSTKKDESDVKEPKIKPRKIRSTQDIEREIDNLEVAIRQAEIAGSRKSARDMTDQLRRLVAELKAIESGDVDFMEGLEVATVDERLTKAPSNEVEKIIVDDPLINAFVDFFINPENSLKTIVAARKFAREHGLDAKAGSIEAKVLEEKLETALVLVSRRIVADASSPSEAYDALVDLYNRQPKLGVRTSKSMTEQAYSTPMPLAYLASRLAGVQNADVIYEPSAGNGALLMETNPKTQKVFANEIDADRANVLRDQGFRVTETDAVDPDQTNGLIQVEGGADVIIMNPPFGAVKDEDGKSQKFKVDKLNTTQIDHAIALQALHAMQDDDARAVMIVGSINKQIKGDEERGKAYNAAQRRKFYYFLYNDYNVVDHFTVPGELYEKQGAGWPVDIIVIHGRGKSSRALPAIEPPQVLNTWTEIKGKLDEKPPARLSGKQDRPAPGTDAERITAQPVEEPSQVSADETDRSGTTAGLDGRKADDTTRIRDGHTQRQRPDHRAVKPAKSFRDRLESKTVEKPGRTDNPPAAVSEEEAPSQLPTRSASKAKSLKTLSPSNMRSANERALIEVEEIYGELDTFVAQELGYGHNADISQYFGAEQVDAIALALHQMKTGHRMVPDGEGERRVNGKAFILGDQTGIGKGRVVAGIMRYAMVQGKTPIFLTEKPNLYGDMIRDLNDIGIQEYLGREVNSFMTNTNEKVPLNKEALDWYADSIQAAFDKEKAPRKRGKFMKTFSNVAKTSKEMDEITKNGLGDVDMIFTTYSQMNTSAQDETNQRRFISSLVPDAIFAFDESHNAFGTQGGWKPKKDGEGDPAPDRAKLIRQFSRDASGVMFSSATYAKRPDGMDLYGRTDLGDAVEDIEQLGDVITAGGVPLQQVVASMLADAGQYVRRERSFEGINYDVDTVDVDKDSYNNFSKSMSSIVMAEAILKRDPNYETWIAQLAEHGAGTAKDGAVGDTGVSSSNFSSLMHNIISQFLLGLKSAPAAKVAIEQIKAGKKPFLTLANTNESFLRKYVDENNINIGDQLNAGNNAFNFSSVVENYLDRTRRVTVKLPDETTEHRTFPLSLATPETIEAYNAAQNQIEAIDNIPVSPIDYIINEIEEAGYKIGEITGRNLRVQYHTNGSITLEQRDKKLVSAGGRRVTLSQYNEGQIDAILANQAGSTGLSAHASGDFGDQRPRHMIIVQAESNIDTHMQMLGRINRTGQVVLPSYTQLSADVPAEARPAAILAKKMASLSANTTASRKSAVSSDAVDFMNQYGDQVVRNVLSTNADWESLMGGDLPDLARKATGKLIMLPVDEQQEFLDMVSEQYAEMIEMHDKLGTNELEAKFVDLQAEVIDREKLKAAEGDSPFQQAVYMDKVRVNVPGKAYKSEDIAGIIRERLDQPKFEPAIQIDNAKRPAQEDLAKRRKELVEKQDAFFSKKLENASTQLAKTNMQMKEKILRTRWNQIGQLLKIGAIVNVEINGEQLPAIVIDVFESGKVKTPLGLSKHKAKLAIPTNSKEITVSFSSIVLERSPDETGGTLITPASWNVDVPSILKMFDKAALESKEERYMITGNIISGFDLAGGKGQILNYSNAKGDIQPGVLMSVSYDHAAFMTSRPIRFKSAGQLFEFMDRVNNPEVKSTDGIIDVMKVGHDDFEIELPKSRRIGGQYFLQSSVRKAADDRFNSVGNRMRFRGPKQQTIDVLNAMVEHGAMFQTRNDQDIAMEIVKADEVVKPSADMQRMIVEPDEHELIGYVANEWREGVMQTTLTEKQLEDGEHYRMAEQAIEDFPDEILRDYKRDRMQRQIMPTFFSALTSSIEKMKQNKATASQWSGMINNAPSVKQEEIEWSGVHEWLAEQQGVGRNREVSISKEDLVEFVKANEIKVEETVLGKRGNEEHAELTRKWDTWLRENNYAPDSMDDFIADMDQGGDEGLGRWRSPEDREYVVDLSRRWEEVTKQQETGEVTRYQQFTLPGGENYRELLLTLPNKYEGAGDNYSKRFQEILDKHGVTAGPPLRAVITPEEDAELGELAELADKSRDGIYKSGHYSQPNILAHVRFNEREDADGKKTLFIEEIQSDWHQQGRDRGYQGELNEERANQREAFKEWAIRKRFISERVSKEYMENWLDEHHAVNSGSYYGEFLNDRPGQLDLRFRNPVPNAPFKTTWQELAFKRALRWAVDNGFDKVAWTPGSVQIDRYSNEMRKNVDEIIYEYAGEDESTGWAIDVIKDGGTIYSNGGLDEKELHDLFGKDIAKKIVENAGENAGLPLRPDAGILKGDNLHIGGAGMISFYDKRLRNDVNKLVKKWGAKVGVDRIGGPDTYVNTSHTTTTGMRYVESWQARPYENTATGGTDWSTWVKGDIGGWSEDETGFDSEKEAITAIEEGHNATLIEDSGKSDVWSVDINDKMREGVAQGLPLFHKNQPKGRIEPGSPLTLQKRVLELYPNIVEEMDILANRVLGHSIQTNLIDRFTKDIDPDGKTAGGYLNRVIWIAMEVTKNQFKVFNHEAIHALKGIKAFTPSEWRILENFAAREWMDKYNIYDRYAEGYIRQFKVTGDRLDALMREEAIAEAFADFSTGSVPESGRVGAIFRKLREFLDRIRNMLAGRGFKSAGDIFADISSGKVAERIPPPLDAPSAKPVSREIDQMMFQFTDETGERQTRTFTPPSDMSVAEWSDRTRPLLNRVARSVKAFVSDPANNTVAVRRLMQDRFIDVKKFQEAIADNNQEALAEHLDAYQAESLYYGKAGQLLDDLRNDKILPIIEALNDRGLSMEDMDLYLYARHAPERNEYIGTINRKFADAGSGMSNDEAFEVMERFHRQGKLIGLREVEPMLRELIEIDRKNRLKAGLIDRETYDEWSTRYSSYVPLRGWENDPEADTDPQRLLVGRRFDIRGKEVHPALGRRTKADSPMAYIIAQAQQGIVRSEKNRVGKTFLRLVQNNPNPAVWQINKKEKKRQLNKTTGMVEEVWDRSHKLADNVFSVKIGGVSTYITLHHTGLAQALKGLGSDNMHWAFRGMAKLNRYLSYMNTALNPEFAISNFVRDLQTSLIHLSEYEVKGLQKQVFKDVMKGDALRGAWRGLGGHTDTEWSQHFREYADAGGKIAFFRLDDIEQIKDRVKTDFKNINPSKPRQLLKGLMAVKDGIDRANQAIENGVRLATYVRLREAGLTKSQAASAARELTVNFNRKGEVGPAMNAMYLFYNAATQGSVRGLQALHRSPKARKLALGIMLLGTSMDIINRMLSDDDDDGNNIYDSLPSWVLERNFVLMIPGWMDGSANGSMIMIMKPYFYNIFDVLGGQMSKVVAGKVTPIEASATVISTAINSFNPIGGGPTPLHDYLPTIATPIVDMFTERTFPDKKVYPFTYDRNKPDSQRYYDWKVYTPTKWATEKLNELTGGSAVRKGDIDISPATLDLVYNFLAGGAGAFAGRTIEYGKKLYSGDEIKPVETPFLRRVYSKREDYHRSSLYYEIENQVLMTEKEIKLFRSTGEKAKEAERRKTYATEIKMVPMVKAAKNQLRQMRKHRRTVMAQKDLSDVARKGKLKNIDDKMTKVQLKVRRKYYLLKRGEK